MYLYCISNGKCCQNALYITTISFQNYFFQYTVPHVLAEKLLTLLLQGCCVKKLLLAVLFIPVCAIASVGVEMKACMGTFDISQDVIFTNDEAAHTLTCNGVDVVMTLKQEDAVGATFEVKVVKNGNLLAQPTVDAPYNDEVSLKCPVDGVDAEFKFIAHNLSVAAA